MGTDTPIAVLVRAPAAALRLLHPAVRAGHQPAARRDPRGARHLAGQLDRPRGQPARRRPRRTRRQVVLPFPVIDNDELAKILHINADGDLPGYATHVVRGLYRRRRRRRALARPARGDLRRGLRGDRRAAPASSCCPTATATADLAPIPSLLLTAAVHHHLIREKTRTQVGLVVEAGDVREVHHVALLIGLRRGRGQPLPRHGVRRGPGARTAPSPASPGEGRREPDQGARQGRAQGDVQDGHLDRRVLPRRPGLRGDRPVPGRSSTEYFTGTVSQLGGIGLDVIAAETAAAARGRLPAGRHPAAAPQAARRRRVPVAPRGRAAPVRPRDGLPAAARHPGAPLRRLQAVHRSGSTSRPSG